MLRRANSNCSNKSFNLINSGGRTTLGAFPLPLGMYRVNKQNLPNNVRLGFLLFEDVFN